MAPYMFDEIMARTPQDLLQRWQKNFLAIIFPCEPLISCPLLPRLKGKNCVKFDSSISGPLLWKLISTNWEGFETGNGYIYTCGK